MPHSNLLTDSFPPKAYHVSKEGYSIATADRGENAKIKVWTARRSSIPKGHVSCSCRKWRSGMLTREPDTPQISFEKGVCHRCPARFINRHSAGANGENPRRHRGMLDISTSRRYAYLRPRPCVFFLESYLRWYTSSYISHTLSSEP